MGLFYKFQASFRKKNGFTQISAGERSESVSGLWGVWYQVMPKTFTDLSRTHRHRRLYKRGPLSSNKGLLA